MWLRENPRFVLFFFFKLKLVTEVKVFLDLHYVPRLFFFNSADSSQFTVFRTLKIVIETLI